MVKLIQYRSSKGCYPLFAKTNSGASSMPVRLSNHNRFSLFYLLDASTHSELASGVCDEWKSLMPVGGNAITLIQLFVATFSRF